PKRSLFPLGTAVDVTSLCCYASSFSVAPTGVRACAWRWRWRLRWRWRETRATCRPFFFFRNQQAIEKGMDTSVCLRNYRVDGAMFWNQF
ncbi:unnamed protein product, partial [Ectocarpus sp. 12 AP-2014]